MNPVIKNLQFEKNGVTFKFYLESTRLRLKAFDSKTCSMLKGTVCSPFAGFEINTIFNIIEANHQKQRDADVTMIFPTDDDLSIGFEYHPKYWEESQVIKIQLVPKEKTKVEHSCSKKLVKMCQQQEKMDDLTLEKTDKLCSETQSVLDRLESNYFIKKN